MVTSGKDILTIAANHQEKSPFPWAIFSGTGTLDDCPGYKLRFYKRKLLYFLDRQFWIYHIAKWLRYKWLLWELNHYPVGSNIVEVLTSLE